MSSLASFASSDGTRSVAPVSSSSELPSSTSPAPQIASSSNGRTTRKRKTTANTWAHAREPQNLEPARCPCKNEKIYYCMHCIDPTYSTTVSTTFRHHLCKVHGIELDSHDHPVKKQRDSLIQDAFAKAGEVSAAKRLMRQEDTLRAAVNRKAALEALVQLVTVRNLSYNCSSWPELHALIGAVNYTAEGIISLSHGSIQKLVSNSYCVHKDILQRRLQSSPSKLHLSADVWTAPNHKAFLGTCVKFVDPESKETLQALLALSELPGLDGPGSHGGAEQWKLLRHVLEDYNIWNKIGFYTGDNHGSNDKLCRLLGEHLQARGINWESRKQRLRCHGHVINLAVQAFLFMDSKEAARVALEQIEGDDEIAFAADFAQRVKAQRALGWRRLGPLGKIHNISVHMRENDYRWNLFKKRAGRSLGLDNDTRWNSWFLLLDVALNLQEHVLDGVTKYWEDYYQTLPITTTTPDLRDKLQPPDEYELLARELDVVRPAMNELDEYQSFITQTPVAIDCSPLTWWLREEQQQRYPRLSRMAVDILSAPAMSAEPERVFSGARRTISWDRCQLGSGTIEKGECMKSWIKSGITQGIPVELIEAESEENDDSMARWRETTPTS
ncbi:hypothetical protein Forpi1262_v016824 [Fusarium oxysporum f. sp. raphani]|uniref:HAT C-terminal dimerisation domain-containing protein n=1 Tax=Fusarium oxysporum f. sp. raphani TaxID=96318 RepID=A0A8J5P5H4_FUSOX|nr:hypothetical protein Forpi1262_v016824 [Fusarium oxysporum f. sp. raphani]